MAVERDKQAKFQAVAEAIFTILIRGGIENLSHTRVAEVSKVSRAWVYKYIGKTSEDLIAFSLDAIGKEFAKIGVLLAQQSADDVDEPALREFLEEAAGHRRRLVIAGIAQGVGKTRIGVTRDIAVGQFGQLLNVRTHVARAQGAVDPD